MNRPKGGLGRGLAALIPTGPSTSTVTDVFLNGPPRRAQSTRDDHGSENVSRETWSADTGGAATPREVIDAPRYAELAVADIEPNRKNPRSFFDEDELAELAHSIKEFGLLQPVVVRQSSGSYELVMGERRWRAAQLAGLTTIPAIVRRTEDADMLRDALLENIHRADLNPLEEAAAYQQLLEEFGVTHDELATRLGRSRPVVSNTIRLLKLPVAVQRRVASGVLSAGHARALLALGDAEQQEDLATRIISEGLSVRGTEEAVTLLSGVVRRRPRTPPAPKARPADLTRLAGRLSDLFDTTVRIEQGRGKGKLLVEFATVDDLERIVGEMGSDMQRRLGDWRLTH